jgi:glycosyltransferase involved in cell wall biosynthesis
MNIGGPATHVVVADSGLADLGWETLLLFGSTEPDEAEVDLQATTIPMERIPNLARPIRPIADMRATAAIARVIRRYRPDVIHTHLSKAGLLGRAAAMATSRAIRIHTFHGTVFGGYFGADASAAIIRAERFLGHHSAAIVALSNRQRDELIDHRVAPAARIQVVPLGLDLERFVPGRDDVARMSARSSLGIPAEAVVVVSIGRLVPIKRLDRLIDAFALASVRAPAMLLYLVGDGSEREALRARVVAAGLADRVMFVGWSAASPDWYAASDVVALTSDREGTPLALIEAAAAGRPVVATDVGGVADVVVDGTTGFVVPASSIDALADSLAGLALDPGLRQRMGGEAPSHAATYSAERLVSDLDTLYREALTELRHPS